MSDTVKLLFGVHAHQPAGNFPGVVRDARDRCYGPFLEVFERHPEFPFAMHVSGWLLAFLARDFPGDIRRLRAMVERGQAEIFGGGDTEPVLAALPDDDRRGQIRALNDRIRRMFGVRPRGAWLTERVWEATIVPSLADGGIEYVAVDDYHFLCTGQPPGALHAHFSTEEDGRRLDLFPISETLRYKFPFAPVHDAIGYLESLPPGAAAIYFDDIEKFGIWPETHDWVYGRRWLEDFIEAIGRSERIEPMRYHDYHGAHRARGIVYLPTVSYIEMGEWALPTRSSARFAQLIERSKRESTLELDKPFLRGGHWRNFFSRYPESNWMHKRMEGASRRFHALPPTDRTTAMRRDLHLAQANDAYWHGLFGGIYLPHLRRQVYGALARLERAMDARSPRKRVERVDVDFDDRREVLLWDASMLAAVKPHEGAAVCELTHYGLAHNFCDTLARREEHYYGKIRAGQVAAPTGAPASIHDRIAFRSQVVPADLEADRHPRWMFVDVWRDGIGPQRLVEYEDEGGRGPAVGFSARCGDTAISKRMTVDPAGLTVVYTISASAAVDASLAVEWNVSMPSCDGPGGSYIVGGQRLGDFASVVDAFETDRLDLVDTELRGALRLDFSIAPALTLQPLYTVSQSEAGFEKIMQAATVGAVWPVRLARGEVLRIQARAAASRAR